MTEDRTHFARPDVARGSLLEAVRQAEIVAPEEDSVTRFKPYVSITPEARDALVAVVDAARQVLDYENVPSRITLSNLREAVSRV